MQGRWALRGPPARLVVVVRELLDAARVVGNNDHRRVHAAAHALHLPEGEGAARGGLTPLDALEKGKKGGVGGSGEVQENDRYGGLEAGVESGTTTHPVLLKSSLDARSSPEHARRGPADEDVELPDLLPAGIFFSEEDRV